MEKMMRNLLITMAYRGTAYHGSQVQDNALTITEVFQDVYKRQYPDESRGLLYQITLVRVL